MFHLNIIQDAFIKIRFQLKKKFYNKYPSIIDYHMYEVGLVGGSFFSEGGVTGSSGERLVRSICRDLSSLNKEFSF